MVLILDLGTFQAPIQDYNHSMCVLIFNMFIQGASPPTNIITFVQNKTNNNSNKFLFKERTCIVYKRTK